MAGGWTLALSASSMLLTVLLGHILKSEKNIESLSIIDSVLKILHIIIHGLTTKIYVTYHSVLIFAFLAFFFASFC